MTWDDYSELMLCLGRLDGLRMSLPDVTDDWLAGVVADLHEIAYRYCPGRVREYGQVCVRRPEEQLEERNATDISV